MPHLDLGTALLIWVFLYFLAGTYAFSFMAKRHGHKTYGLSSLGSVLIVPLEKGTGTTLWRAASIFGVMTIFLVLPFLLPEYIIAFLITALAFSTVIFALGVLTGADNVWSKEFLKEEIELHNQLARYGLSQIVIFDRVKYQEILADLIQHEHFIAFLDKLNFRGLTVLLSVLVFWSALVVALVNWPVFWILGWFGVEIAADFSVLFLALVGTALMLTITERLILR